MQSVSYRSDGSTKNICSTTVYSRNVRILAFILMSSPPYFWNLSRFHFASLHENSFSFVRRLVSFVRTLLSLWHGVLFIFFISLFSLSPFVCVCGSYIKKHIKLLSTRRKHTCYSNWYRLKKTFPPTPALSGREKYERKVTTATNVESDDGNSMNNCIH